jgi:hypothetical protein
MVMSTSQPGASARRPGHGTGRAAAWTSVALGLLTATVGTASLALALSAADRADGFLGFGEGVLALVYGAVGVRLTTRHRRNAVGWILLLVGLLQGVTGAAGAYPDLADSRGWPLAAELVWLSNWIWAPSLALLATFLPVLFPDGRPLTPRWRTVVAGSAAATLVVTGALAIPSWPLRDRMLQSSPDDFQAALPTTSVAVFGVSLAAMGAFALLAVVSLVLRFRRSRGAQRAQLKWFALGGTVTVAGTALTFIVPPPSDPVTGTLWLIGVVVVLTAAPLSVGVAVLRYRLYEIDRVVSRTLSYAALTGSLLLVYVMGVVLLGPLLAPIASGSHVTVAASTLLVAALFQPLRRRVQTVLDRRFNRARYDAQLVVEALAGRLRDDLDLTMLRQDLLTAVDGTVAPVQRELWLAEREPGPPVR